MSYICGFEIAGRTPGDDTWCERPVRVGGKKCWQHDGRPISGMTDVRRMSRTLANRLGEHPKMPRSITERAKALAEDIAEVADQLAASQKEKPE